MPSGSSGLRPGTCLGFGPFAFLFFSFFLREFYCFPSFFFLFLLVVGPKGTAGLGWGVDRLGLAARLRGWAGSGHGPPWSSGAGCWNAGGMRDALPVAARAGRGHARQGSPAATVYGLRTGGRAGKRRSSQGGARWRRSARAGRRCRPAGKSSTAAHRSWGRRWTRGSSRTCRDVRRSSPRARRHGETNRGGGERNPTLETPRDGKAAVVGDELDAGALREAGGEVESTRWLTRKTRFSCDRRRGGGGCGRVDRERRRETGDGEDASRPRLGDARDPGASAGAAKGFSGLLWWSGRRSRGAGSTGGGGARARRCSWRREMASVGEKREVRRGGRAGAGEEEGASGERIRTLGAGVGGTVPAGSMGVDTGMAGRRDGAAQGEGRGATWARTGADEGDSGPGPVNRASPA
ncbi:hypothetical protein BRADI_1g13356v3, partial [Brachypodium distachyon]